MSSELGLLKRDGEAKVKRADRPQKLWGAVCQSVGLQEY